MKFSTLLQHVTPHRNTLLLIMILLLAGSLAALLNPWIAGLLARSILTPVESAYVPQIILLLWLGLLAIRSMLSFGTQYMVGISAETMSAQLRSRVYEHLQVLPLDYHQARHQGDLLTLLASDSEIISQFVTGTLVQLLPNLFVFAGALGMMAWLDPLIALLAALLLPVYYLAMKITGRKIRPLSSQWINSWSGLVAFVEENLGMLPAIKAFTRETLENENFGRKNLELLTLSKRQTLVQSILPPVVGFLAGAGLLLLLWVGLLHLDSGRIDASALVSLLLYAMLLTQPISGLANVYGQVMRARGAADRLLDFFAAEPEPYHRGTKKLRDVKGAIEFDRISFNYPQRPGLFKNFSLFIEAGETIALTGPNGAGKSTLAHLLMRFIEPASGQIRIDGINIADVGLSNLRQQIGLVAQQTLLLNGTVQENIAYGFANASESSIKKAAKAARALEFIENLPDGFQTIIGDQGIKLSGGQRQRLSLARSLLKNPAILILDEATAMFDPSGESEFIKECREELTDKTVILITHRPASLALADRIFELELKDFQAHDHAS